MQRIVRLVSLWVLTAVNTHIGIGEAAADEPPPVEVFGTFPVETGAVLSSDGHYLAWFDRHQTKQRVVIFDVQEKKVHRLIESPEDLKLRSLSWARDNATLLLVLSKTSRPYSAVQSSFERFRYLAFDVNGGPGVALNDLWGSSYLISLRGSKINTVVMWSGGDLVEVDIHSGNSTLLKAGNRYTTRFVVDRAGHGVAREDWDYVHDAYKVLALFAAGPWLILHLTSDAAARAAAAHYLPRAAAAPLVGVWAFQLDGIFIGATHTADMRNAMLLSLAIFIAAWWALRPFGNAGLWAAFYVHYLARTLTLLRYSRSCCGLCRSNAVAAMVASID